MKRTILLFTVCISLLYQANAQQTFVIERSLSVTRALKLQDRFDELGIVGNAGSGDIEVRMYHKPDYVEGNTANGLIYGTRLNSSNQNVGWQIRNDDPWYCSGFWAIPWFCGQSTLLYSDTFFPKVIPNYVRRSASSTFFSYSGARLDVVVELTLYANATLADVATIHLPGLDDGAGNKLTLKAKDFVTINWASTNFDHQFISGKDFMAVAHRGYWRDGGVSENSENAVAAANQDQDIDWMELDFRVTGPVDNPHTILFHDDNPQLRLQDVWRDVTSSFPDPKHSKGIFDPDVNWDVLKDYHLYDRFDDRTDDKISDPDRMFSYIRSEIDAGKIQKPIQLDITLNGPYHYYDPSVSGGVTSDKQWTRPETKENVVAYKKHIFLSTISKACEYGLTQYVNFKGRYTYNDPIWESVADTLFKYSTFNGQSYVSTPKIAYLPRVGEELSGEPYLIDVNSYFDDWLEIYDHQKNGVSTSKQFAEGVSIEGMEIRIKYIPDANSVSDADNFQRSQHNRIAAVKSRGLRCGLSSPAPFNCVGDQVNTAQLRARTQANFESDLRTDLEWLTNSVGFNNSTAASNRLPFDQPLDFIIADYPDFVTALQNKASGSSWSRTISRTSNAHTLLGEDELKTNGFSIAFKTTLNNLKNKVIAEVQHPEQDKAFLHFKADNDGNISVRRVFKDMNNNYYNWSLKFWETVNARHTLLNGTDEIYVVLIQEPKQVRLHIGMPDGTFDCLFFAYGLSTSVLGQDWAHAPINAPTQQSVRKLWIVYNDSNFPGIQLFDHGLCRTDAFHLAYQQFFSAVSPPISETDAAQKYEILNHYNPYRDISDLTIDQKIVDDDITRLGSCNNLYDLNSGARVAAGNNALEISETNEPEIESNYSFYPNPSEGGLNIKFARQFDAPEKVLISLLDLQGKLLVEDVIEVEEGVQSLYWNYGVKLGNTLPNGVYINKIKSSQGHEMHRIIYDCRCN